jgi:serine/threonine protein kinase
MVLFNQQKDKLDNKTPDKLENILIYNKSKIPAAACTENLAQKRSLSNLLKNYFSFRKRSFSNGNNSSSDDEGTLIPKHPVPDSDQFEILQRNIPHINHPADVQFCEKYSFPDYNQIIGQGTSGVVRLAVSKSDPSRIFAVKEFRKRKKTEEYHEYLRKMTSEYCIASTMVHENIVQTIDIAHEHDRWYEVMEYCEGGDLFATIRAGQQSEDEVLCYFKQLVAGVAYLHEQGVCHRDLKPDNILINKNGVIKIADFGTSCVFHLQWENCMHKMRGLCGSSPYIAPEEFEGEEYEGQSVDMWSIGIILFAMLFRAIPWESAQPSDPSFSMYLETGKIPQVESLGISDLKTVIYRLLEKTSTKRIKIDELMDMRWFSGIPVCVKEKKLGISPNHSHEIINFEFQQVIPY